MEAVKLLLAHPGTVIDRINHVSDVAPGTVVDRINYVSLPY